MKKANLQTVFLLLLTTLSSAYAGTCVTPPYDTSDCKVKAEQGYSMAQHNLGLMYDIGEGVPQDNVMAHMFTNLAAANGNDSAAKSRDRVAKRMSSLEIAEAQKLAREWMASH